MRVPRTLDDLRRRTRAPHSIPRFEGKNSRSHHNRALLRLAWLAARHGAIQARALARIETFVQFAGFPRSGHSLIGSIIDAHPQARVSHELDAMGLLAKGMPQWAIFALIDYMAREFTRHGRCWNGYSYLVADAHHHTARPLRVIGDKKGDAAVRWIAHDPSLLDRLDPSRRPAKKWILVLRNPFDNIATMSLRHGRVYDVLRTNTGSAAEFHAALREKQRAGEIADRALDSQIDEYARLCATVEQMKRKTVDANWLDFEHEALTVDPARRIRNLIAFLELPEVDGYVEQCAAMINPRANRSRDLIDWPEHATARVRQLCRDHSFLQRYYDSR